MGRDYRLGYSMTLLQGAAMNFEFGLDAQRRQTCWASETPTAALFGRVTATW